LADIHGSSTSYGISNSLVSDMQLSDSYFYAHGGSSENLGLKNNNSSIVVERSTFKATDGTTSAGVYNYESTVTFINCWLAGGKYGIYNVGFSGTYNVVVEGSTVNGWTNTIFNDTEFYNYLGASQVAGGNMTGGGFFKCAGVYDENFDYFATTCP